VDKIEDATLQWLILHHLGLTDGELRRLQRRWREPEAMLHSGAEQWRGLGLAPSSAAALQAWRQQPDAHPAALRARHDRDWLHRNQGQLLWPGHPLWPPLLTEIATPPVLLYVLGDAALLARPQLAVVGSRRATRPGRLLAAGLVKDLVEAGFVITSGLAHGIDGAAHQAALTAGGATIAVLGTGADVVYPRQHAGLYRAVVRQGAVVSELRLGSPPRPEHFPRRNRLISGLSVGVLVVEAALRSGSLITARMALEQNREVFAVPGSPASHQARGCNDLLRDGAVLVESSEDILSELGVWWHPSPSVPAPRPSLDAAPLAVYQVLAESLQSVEELAQGCGLACSETAALLIDLELAGLAEQEGGLWRQLPPPG